MTNPVAHSADVLVLGGGPAGIWAALTAAKEPGIRVVLVDKGHCGASGPAAYGATTLWNVAPGEGRATEIRKWSSGGEYLGEPDWMSRVMDETRRRLGQLARWGYVFPRYPEVGGSGRLTTIGPDFLMLLRRRALRAGVKIFDHHPALQLLVDADGTVSGASGVATGDGYRRWQVRARAVVLATGGCAFQSGSAGTDGNTGDGHLMAAELGAELSGMEFSAAYGLAASRPAVSSLQDRVWRDGPMLHFATFYDDSGRVIAENGTNGTHLPAVFAAISDGRRVFARLHNAPPSVRETMRRTGQDPRNPVPLRAVQEGTVRGTGGLRIVSADCGTTVPGLFAAGDVTTREAIAGAVSGVGGQAGAWAMASGVWAGAGAADFARDRRAVGRVGTLAGAGMSPLGEVNPHGIIGLVQEYTVPLRRSYWRNSAVLRDSMCELDGLWPCAVYGLGGSGPTLLRSREAAAMLAVARWATHSALVRTESRGIHRRTDHPAGAAQWQVRLATGGLDELWVRTGARLTSNLLVPA